MTRNVVSIHQPHYFPWLGLLAKIACSDAFVFLDNVQFEKNGWQNRTRYSTAGGIKFLTLPVRQKGIVSNKVTISDIELSDPHAGIKHWRTLSQRYGKRPGWKRIADRLEAVLIKPEEKMISLCLATTALTMEIFGVKPKLLYSSEMTADGAKGERVVNIVKAAGGTTYLSGTGARDYLEPEAFQQAGLGLVFQEFKHPVYKQSTGVEFQPSAFALEWFIEEPDAAVEKFQAHLRANANQLPRSIIS